MSINDNVLYKIMLCIQNVAHMLMRWWRKNIQKFLKKKRHRAGDLDLGDWLHFE